MNHSYGWMGDELNGLDGGALWAVISTLVAVLLVFAIIKLFSK